MYNNFNMNDILKSDKMLVTDTICRICLRPYNDMISIFRKFIVDTECQIYQKTSQIMSVLELLEYITQIQVHEKFSSMICKTCVKSAHDAFIFKTKIRKTELWLQTNISILKKVTPNEKTDYKKSVNAASDQVSLQDDTQAIKTWLESKISKLEIVQHKTKKCDNPVIQKTGSHDFQETLSASPELNKKCITIVKRKRKAETVLQSVSKLPKKLPEGKINNLQIKTSEEMVNSKMPEIVSPRNKKDDKSTENIKGFQDLTNTKKDLVSNKKCVDKYKPNKNLIELLPNCLTDHDYNLIFCEVCSEYFPSKYSYEEHKTIHTVKNHKCKYCTNKFKTFAHLKNHLKSHANKIDQVLAQYTLDINYPLYMNSKQENFFMCKVCVVVYKRFSSLSEHLKITHGTKGKKYCCSVCEEGFNKRLDLQTHLQAHTEGLPYFCVHCPKKFNKMLDLINHVKTHSSNAPLFNIPYEPNFVKYRKDPEEGDIPFLKHKNDKIYLCPHCGKKYNQRYLYKAHLEFHAGNDKAICQICGKTYRRAQLNNHMRTHDHSVPHECDICGKAYKQKSYLKYHKMTHTKQLPYKCEVCGKLFKARYYLRSHMKYHNNERNHECHICGTKYFKKGQLVAHLLTHTQERPFTCKYCDKSFRTSTNCKYHEFAHESKRPFECNICEKSYSRPNTLQQHMKIHNKTQNCIVE